MLFSQLLIGKSNQVSMESFQSSYRNCFEFIERTLISHHSLSDLINHDISSMKILAQRAVFPYRWIGNFIHHEHLFYSNEKYEIWKSFNAIIHVLFVSSCII